MTDKTASASIEVLRRQMLLKKQQELASEIVAYVGARI